MIKKILFTLVCFAVTNASGQNYSTGVYYEKSGSADLLKKHVEYLSSQKLLGRSTLTGHDLIAADYVDSLFRSFSLEPFVKIPEQNNNQPFSILVRKPNERKMSFMGFSYAYVADFICLGPDPENKEYEVVFGGFGDPAELEGLNLEGKALLILTSNLRVGAMKVNEYATSRGCSMIMIANHSQNSQFENISRQVSTDHQATRFNLLNTVHMGASRFFARFGNPVPQILISDKLASRLLGENPSAIAARIQEGKPNGITSHNRKVRFNFDFITDTIVTNNIVGYIPAQSSTEKNVIVCAHFDHLAPDSFKWFPGADDNASGMAVLLELARQFSRIYSNGNLPKKNIVFAAFTAEEIGLLGSMHYSKNPRFNIDSTSLVINLDMIGRESKKWPDQRIIFVDGTSSKLDEFVNILKNKNTSPDLVIGPKGLDDANLFSVSDHYHFNQKGIPAFLINTGIHSDYHQSTDTPEKLRYQNMSNIFELLFSTINHFANHNSPWDINDN